MMEQDKNCLEDFTINKLKTSEYETMQKLAKEQALKIYDKIQNNIKASFSRGESKSRNYVFYECIDDKLHPINIQYLKKNKFRVFMVATEYKSKDKSTIVINSYFICWEIDTNEDVNQIKDTIKNYYHTSSKCTIYEL